MSELNKCIWREAGGVRNRINWCIEACLLQHWGKCAETMVLSKAELQWSFDAMGMVMLEAGSKSGCSLQWVQWATAAGL